MLIDAHGRTLTYLRLAITDRCNLRCHYCMPMQGLEWLPRKDMLSYEEMLRLCEIFSELGIEKIRFTGGEPTLRKDFIELAYNIYEKGLFRSMHLTTNGTLPLIDNRADVAEIWKSVNVSLDSLDPENFKRITCRDEWKAVMATIEQLIEAKVPVRVNMVVMDGQNEHEILNFVDWAYSHPIDVRFIEEMPFNGAQGKAKLVWNSQAIRAQISSKYDIQPCHVMDKGETAEYFQSPQMKGRVGIIAAYSRSFCGNCNRLRVTPQGVLRTCLYSDKGLQLRDAMRNGLNNDEIKQLIRDAVAKKAVNGFEAEEQRSSFVSESMATIGG